MTQDHLRKRIEDKLTSKEILLISHVVIGYPNPTTAKDSVRSMAESGVDLIELQLPFSDPLADGPFLTKANQDMVSAGIKLQDGFDFANEVTTAYPDVDFLFMTYFNMVFHYGVDEFVKKTAELGVKGIIIPDLPVELADDYISACSTHGVSPIFMFTPTTTSERMKTINEHASGFIYCQARLGVTGSQTKFNDNALAYIQQCREHTDLPLAMGFGIQTAEDVAYLKGKVDIAICCTQAVKVLVDQGADAMGGFLKGLR